MIFDGKNRDKWGVSPYVFFMKINIQRIFFQMLWIVFSFATTCISNSIFVIYFAVEKLFASESYVTTIYAL